MEKKDNIEITAGEFYLRVPRNTTLIKEIVNILVAIDMQIQREKIEDAQFGEETEIPYLSSHPEKPEITRIEAIDTKDTKRKIKDKEKELSLLEKQKKDLEEQEEQEITEEIKNDEDKLLIESPEKYKRCPRCDGKLKKKKVKQYDDAITQEIRCKDKKCGWHKEIIIKI